MEECLTIVLLGNTGGGKSASGNTILGQHEFESKPNFRPVTKQVSEATRHVFGKRITVVDTPGILGSEEQIKTVCQDVLRSGGPCLFLVAVRVGWFSKDDQGAVETALSVVGPEAFKHCYLLFTGGDALRGEALDDIIREEGDSSLQAVVERFGGRHHLFNNQHGGQEQVRVLLEKSGHQRPASPAVPEEPVCPEARRIVVLGRPGGGKSSSGNTILGSKRFKSDCDFALVSTECVSNSAEVHGRQVTVVDTPGLTDALDADELFMEIMKTLFMASPGPHAFIIVVRIGKISEADVKLFELLPKLFGADALKYTMVLFTHGDELRGQSIDQKVRDNRFVSELVSRCGWRYCVFDNTQRGNTQQVRTLLKKVDEMVTENGGNHYSSEMFAMAETFIWEEKNLSGGTYAAPGGTWLPGVEMVVREEKKESLMTIVWRRLKPFLLNLILGADLWRDVTSGGGYVYNTSHDTFSINY